MKKKKFLYIFKIKFTLFINRKKLVYSPILLNFGFYVIFISFQTINIKQVQKANAVSKLHVSLQNYMEHGKVTCFHGQVILVDTIHVEGIGKKIQDMYVVNLPQQFIHGVSLLTQLIVCLKSNHYISWLHHFIFSYCKGF